MDILFLLSSALAVLGGVLMVSRKNAVYALLFLLVSFAGAAGVFYSLNATFIAISQILVYAGAISVLFLFVLMFMDLRRAGESVLPQRVGSLSVYDPAATIAPAARERDKFDFHPAAAIAALTMFAVMAVVIVGLPAAWDSFGTVPVMSEVKPGQPTEQHYFGATAEFGAITIQDFPLHFEVVGLVVLVGVMGAVVLAGRLRDEEKPKAEEKAAPDAHAAGHH